MNDWKTFFDHHAPIYMQNGFTKNTLTEVDFIIQEFQLLTGSAILDMGCGTGRHSIELARHGYQMTGVDLSTGMLTEARKAAQAAGVQVEWIETDATRFRSERQFDGAICLCEGSFGLVTLQEDADAHDRAILANIYQALKPGAPFLLTALNGLRAIRLMTQTDVDQGKFDLLSLVESYNMEIDTPEGKKSVLVREKKYLPHELAHLCKQSGFQVTQIWGGTAGAWNRKSVQLDEWEVMIMAKK